MDARSTVAPNCCAVRAARLASFLLSESLRRDAAKTRTFSGFGGVAIVIGSAPGGRAYSISAAGDRGERLLQRTPRASRNHLRVGAGRGRALVRPPRRRATQPALAPDLTKIVR